MSRAENESFSFGSPSGGWPMFCDCGRKLRRDICQCLKIEDNGASNED